MKNIKTSKKQILLLPILIITFIILTASCASLSRPGEPAALEVINLINTGDSASLKAMSADTVLFDSEILHGSVLTAALWDGLTASGFKIEQAEVIESRPPSADDAKYFGKSGAVSAFFARYIPDNSMFFMIASDNTGLILILGPSENGTSEIIAVGGIE